jgi:lysophospholipase L1-like esterase
MKRFRRVLVALVATLALGGATASSAMAADPLQLGLGDSWAFGFGAAVPSEGGYVAQLHEALKDGFDCSPSDNPKPGQGCKKLELNNLAVPGATTPTMIANQLPTAVPILQARNGNDNPRDDVEVVTISIGGNDVTNPIISACLGGLSPTCVTTIASEFAAYTSDLNSALSTIRSAAGPDTRIVLGTYDNGFAQCFLGAVPGAVQLANIALEGFPPFVPQGLHDIMRSVGATYDVEIAEVFGDLGPTDWVGGSDCLHPNDTGYDKVTTAFADVLLG